MLPRCTSADPGGCRTPCVQVDDSGYSHPLWGWFLSAGEQYGAEVVAFHAQLNE